MEQAGLGVFVTTPFFRAKQRLIFFIPFAFLRENVVI